MAPVPEISASVPTTLALAAWLGREVDLRPARASFEERNHIPLSAMADLSQRSLATIIYPHAGLCDDTACEVERAGRALYSDDNHLSLYGAASIEAILAQAF